jgi:Protein of unknown function (DUF3300)
MTFSSNWLRSLAAAAAGLALVAVTGSLPPALAQDQQPQQPQQQQTQERLTDQQIQQLVAPVALYPDPLLAQILTASTYPLEIVMAARWSKDHPDLKGKALEDAMGQQPWDPSVRGLTATPQVLTMMNDKLDWTQQLGEAYLAQPDDVTKAIQTLRMKAESTGNLKSSKEIRVRHEVAPAAPAGEAVIAPEYIVVEPVDPEVMYVPVYDPVVIYGVGYWPPAYAPFFWYPPWWTVGPVWGFWPAVYVGPVFCFHPVWAFGYVQVTNVVVFNKVYHTNYQASGPMKWSFNAQHHSGAFKNVALQQKFGNVHVNQNIKNTNFNLNQKLNAGNKNLNLNTGKKNTLNNNLSTGNKNKVSNLNAGNKNTLNKNVNTGNKNKVTNLNTGHNVGNPNRHVNQQPKFNQPKFNQQPKVNQQPKFSSQNFNRMQNFHPGPVGGNRPVGGGGGQPNKPHH